MEDSLANQLDLKQLAARGAAVRLAELQAEMDAIRAAFPGLRGGAGAGSRKRAGGRGNGGITPGAAQQRRPRRAMSAAEKRAVSLRMKRYWAARRKAKGAAAK